MPLSSASYQDASHEIRSRAENRATHDYEFIHLQELPIEHLGQFEWVQDQFQDWGLIFEGAITMVPSNPRFADAASSRLSLIPGGRRQEILIHINAAVQFIQMQVRGYRDLAISAIDHHQQSCPSVIVDRQRQIEGAKAPTEIITVDVRQVATLRLSSAGVYLIDHIRC